jgi:two-component system, LytTR family, response regulator
MLRAIVVDDEWYNLEEIADLVDATGFIQVIEKHMNPKKALQNAELSKPDLAFLDIEMPEIDGITLAERLYQICPGIRVVFITSWNQYAVQAFDLSAIDYILKPIKKERFLKMVNKIKSEYDRNEYSNSRIKISCFDKLEVSIGGLPVKWERAKAEELFAYLLLHHGSYVHKESIIQDLWMGYETDKALRILQTVVCRIRNVFANRSKEILLDYSQNKYALLLQDVDCDLLEIENALSHYKIEDESTYEHIENALSLYKSGFLVHQGYLWSLEKDEKLRKELIRIRKEIIARYYDESRKEDMCHHLQKLILLAPYDSEANYQLLKYWIEKQEEDKARNHYEWLSKLLKDQYDMKMPQNIIELFEKM